MEIIACAHKRRENMTDKLIPLIYLASVALIAAGLSYLEVDTAMVGLIIGAGITRIKIGAPK